MASVSVVDEVIENVIRATAREHQLPVPQLTMSTELVDELGFTSWTIVSLFADLEKVFGVDPLYADEVAITGIRTVGDVCDLYQNCLARAD